MGRIQAHAGADRSGLCRLKPAIEMDVGRVGLPGAPNSLAIPPCSPELAYAQCAWISADRRRPMPVSAKKPSIDPKMVSIDAGLDLDPFRAFL